jgi:hypothetical protein
MLEGESCYLLSSVGYFLVGYFKSLWAIAFLFIFYFVRGLAGLVIKDYVNKIIESEKRATILSVKSMLTRLMFSVIGPFIGWINDVYSLSIALYSSGFIFLILGGTSLIFLGKNKVL